MIPGDAERGTTVMTIVGPTAVGKTGVAVAVARALDGEIVSADSRQVYRGMDIGTAKPGPGEVEAAPHHLIDIVDPSERYDAARFAADAEKAMASILERDRTPIVVGGTGFYVTSLFRGLFEGPGRHPAIRARLEREVEASGPQSLHDRLAAVDPESARRIHPNDTVRTIRALEVHEATGRPLSSWHGSGRRNARFRPWYVVLTMERALLYERIERRVDRMIERGLLEEVTALVASGRLAAGMPAADALGYRELLPVVRGERELDDAVAQIKQSTRRFAKRQMTWFSKVPADVGVDRGEAGIEEAARAVLAAWRRRGGGL
jgi:tRNA dimethylallyltransferase